MKLINVGLHAPKGVLTSGEIKHALEAEGIQVLRNVTVPPGKSEPTFIALIGETDLNAVYDAAEYLGQDAIAVYDLENFKGALIGPRASAWGEFDRSLFQVL